VDILIIIECRFFCLLINKFLKDTAGQEDYPAVRDGYLKHGDGFLLVFDLTNRETFESVKNHRWVITNHSNTVLNLI
jgi:GTPase SAR1 family protein